MNTIQPQPAQTPHAPQAAQALHALLTNFDSLFAVAREYELEMHVQGLSRQLLADKAGIGIDRVDDFLNRKKPYVSLSTFLKIAKALGKDPLQPAAAPKEQEAPEELGGYTAKTAKPYIGEYLCVRPLFGNPKYLNAYLIDLLWNEKEHYLYFQERKRFDKRHEQKGKVYIPNGQPYISLLTADGGEVRHIILSRNKEGVMRGLIQTLFNRGGELYTPVCGPIVLRKMNGEVIGDADLGQIDPKKPKYKTYRELLTEVLENDYARLIS
jgi:transcriptional regulator with XRE-family HTH domain